MAVCANNQQSPQSEYVPKLKRWQQDLFTYSGDTKAVSAEILSQYYVFLSINRDCANWALEDYNAGLRAVKANMLNPLNIRVITEIHQGVGFIQTILIHESDTAGLFTADEYCYNRGNTFEDDDGDLIQENEIFKF